MLPYTPQATQVGVARRLQAHIYSHIPAAHKLQRSARLNALFYVYVQRVEVVRSAAARVNPARENSPDRTQQNAAYVRQREGGMRSFHVNHIRE